MGAGAMLKLTLAETPSADATIATLPGKRVSTNPVTALVGVTRAICVLLLLQLTGVVKVAPLASLTVAVTVSVSLEICADETAAITTVRVDEALGTVGSLEQAITKNAGASNKERVIETPVYGLAFG